MELLSQILARMWFCMGIRPTVVHLLKLLYTLRRWIPRLPPLILGRHTHPKKGGSVVVRVIANELIPGQENCVVRNGHYTTHFGISFKNLFLLLRVMLLKNGTEDQDLSWSWRACSSDPGIADNFHQVAITDPVQLGKCLLVPMISVHFTSLEQGCNQLCDGRLLDVVKRIACCLGMRHNSARGAEQCAYQSIPHCCPDLLERLEREPDSMLFVILHCGGSNRDIARVEVTWRRKGAMRTINLEHAFWSMEKIIQDDMHHDVRCLSHTQKKT